ncbi:MAG: hypothetical protein COU69_03730 [Candidatus Pacebacteria bacterium CG10_big_fil_rev_8_21_14_0_10_56_10]|nr:MAG: hypothetical protein COU69_03730 [Candidatus Pacebacteria bacterium CG10_big_fil_rev_8_21_14_0_10_56_10]
MPDQPNQSDQPTQLNQSTWPGQSAQPDQSARSNRPAQASPASPGRQPNQLNLREQKQATRQDTPQSRSSRADSMISSALIGKVAASDQTSQNNQQNNRQSGQRVSRPTAGQQRLSPSPVIDIPKPPPDEKSFAGTPKPQPEQTVLEWQAPSRPFKQRDSRYYSTVGLIVFLIVLILFFAGQFLPIAVVIAVAFLAYVLSSVPPNTITNKITTYGIRSDNDIYYWEELGRYWFEEKYDSKLIKLEVIRFPHRVTVLLGDQTEELVTAVLSEVLLQEKPKDTFVDKAANWLQQKVPLDG